MNDPHGAPSRQSVFAMLRAGVLLVLFVALLALLWRAFDAVLLILAGILFAVFLDGLTRALGRVMGGPRVVRLALVCAVMVALLAGMLVSSGAMIASQIDNLTDTLDEQYDAARANLDNWGVDLPGAGDPGEEMSGQGGGDETRDDGGTGEEDEGGEESKGSGSLASFLPDPGGMFGQARNAIGAAFGAVGNFVVIVFLGLFFAAQPGLYRDGTLAFVPRARRARLREVMDEMGEAMRHWLVGQSITMLVIALFVWGGLMAGGIAPSFILGLQAGLLAFIPNVGPILAAVPILFAGLAQGLFGVLWALGVYVVVQALESYILTPLIQRKAIQVPPGALFAGQVVLGLMFGVFGLALATPFMAALKVGLDRLYREDVLGERPEHEAAW